MKRVTVLLAVVCLLLFFCACGKENSSFPPDADFVPIDLRVAVGGARPAAEDFLSDDARARCQKDGVTVLCLCSWSFDYRSAWFHAWCCSVVCMSDFGSRRR